MAQAGHVVASLLVASLILQTYRWVRARSRLAAGLMATGIIARAAIGVTLFWISFLDLSVLSRFHSGGGFWRLAPDARIYFEAATVGYVEGLAAIPANTASPAYVALLASWMRLVGLSPASGMFLNLALYTLLCGLIVRICLPMVNAQERFACAACLAPFSVAPALLVHSGQPLKDEPFVFLIAIMCLCALSLFAAHESPEPASGWPKRLLALVGVGTATYAMSGMRFYFVEMVWVCLVPAALASVWRARRANPGRAAAIALAILGAAAIGPLAVMMDASPAPLRAGSVPLELPAAAASPPQPNPAAVEQPVAGRRRSLSSTGLTWESPLAQVRAARANFMRAVGESSFGSQSEADDRLLGPILIGLVLLFVPISLVRWLGWTDVEGGQGLFAVTDIDTALLDLSIAVSIGLLAARRASIRQSSPYVWFVIGLAVMTTVLLAFVVTNFGTLFRLRLMMATPLWMLPLASRGSRMEE